MPDIISCDQGSAFTSDLWKKLSEENGIQIKFSRTQHHNGLSLCERYHAPTRTTYRKIRLESPNLSQDLVLPTAVTAMNDLFGDRMGLYPRILVFGTMPRYTSAGLGPDLQNQRESREGVRIAREDLLESPTRIGLSVLSSKRHQSQQTCSTNQYTEPKKVISAYDGGRRLKFEDERDGEKRYSVS